MPQEINYLLFTEVIMLNVTEHGDITLTIRGKVIGVIDAVAAKEMSAVELVRLENRFREEFYDRKNGFYSSVNQEKSWRVLTSEERHLAYPLAVIPDPEAFNQEWAAKRRNAIDD